jgi:hypothetical protein
MSNETDRLLLEATNVQLFLRKLEMLNLEAQHRLALHQLHQAHRSRAPAASPGGEANSAAAPAGVEHGDSKPAANAEPGK